MSFVVATEAHVISERPPLSLVSGDVVTVGRRDSELACLRLRHDCQAARAGCRLAISRPMQGRRSWKLPYNTTELATRSGEILEVVVRDDESRVALVSLDRWARGLGSEPHRRPDLVELELLRGKLALVEQREQRALVVRRAAAPDRDVRLALVDIEDRDRVVERRPGDELPARRWALDAREAGEARRRCPRAGGCA